MTTVIGDGDLYYFKQGAWRSVTPFSPLDLAPELWLDASETATIVEASGRVSQWNDRSGNSRNLVQATGAAQPYTGSRTQNGLNVLDFQGAQWMEGGDILDVLEGGLTQMVVYKSDVASNHAVMGKSRASNQAGRYSFIRDTNLIALFQDVALANATVADSSTSVRVLTQRITRNTTAGNELFRDNVLAASGNTSGTTSYDTSHVFGIGAYQNASGNLSPPLSGYYLDGFIAEALVWNRALTDVEMDVMHSYLNGKWGI